LVNQFPGGGNPGDALQLLIETPFSPSLLIRVGAINPAFSYDPSTQGAITSIDLAEDHYVNVIDPFNFWNKALINNPTSGNWLLEQGGSFYYRTVALPWVPGVYTTVKSSGTVATDWNQIDSATGTVNTSSHPDFSASGSAIEFGVVGAASLHTQGPAATVDIRFDNLSIDLHTAPEPGILTSGLAGAVTLCGLGLCHRKLRARLMSSAHLMAWIGRKSLVMVRRMNDMPTLTQKTTARLLVAFVATAAMGAMPATAGEIYVSRYNGQGDVVSVYNATTGATIIADLVPGLIDVHDVALSGPSLFVLDGYLQGKCRVGQYDAATGTAVNAALISGLFDPLDIALSGSNLFVSDQLNGTIGEYTMSGATVNAALITGLHNPNYIALSGSNLFVPNADTGTIGKYTTSGATVNAAFISGLSQPLAVAVYGSNLYVANRASGTIGEYNATTGAAVNAALVHLSPGGLNDIEVYGGNLFVQDGTRIGEYNATTGAPINAALITGLTGAPWGFTVVPEPSSLLLVAVAAAAGVGFRRRKWSAGSPVRRPRPA